MCRALATARPKRHVAIQPLLLWWGRTHHVSTGPLMGAGRSSLTAVAAGSTQSAKEGLPRARCSQAWQSADTTGSDELSNVQTSAN
jgi:hypothetical protein